MKGLIYCEAYLEEILVITKSINIFINNIWTVYIHIYTLYSFIIWITIWLDDYLVQNSDNWILTDSSKKYIWTKNCANILCTSLGRFLCLRCISIYAQLDTICLIIDHFCNY